LGPGLRGPQGHLPPSEMFARGKPEFLEFGNEWEDESCGAFSWYKKLPCRRIRSIRHMAPSGPSSTPRHDVLLIRLVDNSTYMVERTPRAHPIPTNKPTTIDVITRIGGPGPDRPMVTQNLVQISYILFSTPPDANQFLALCYYSTRELNPQPGHNVELVPQPQFFCWVIISILAKVSINWRNVATHDHWKSALNAALATTFWANSVGPSTYDNLCDSPNGNDGILVANEPSLQCIVVRSSHPWRVILTGATDPETRRATHSFRYRPQSRDNLHSQGVPNA
jgi:hypothetical protein